VGFQRRTTAVCGGYWWLWVREEAWDAGNGFGRKKEKEMAVFQGYTKYKG